MRVLLDIDNDQQSEIVVDSLLWMYYNGDLTKKERKAYRTVLNHYLNAEEYVERFGTKEVYK